MISVRLNRGRHSMPSGSDPPRSGSACRASPLPGRIHVVRAPVRCHLLPGDPPSPLKSRLTVPLLRASRDGPTSAAPFVDLVKRQRGRPKDPAPLQPRACSDGASAPSALTASPPSFDPACRSQIPKAQPKPAQQPVCPAPPPGLSPWVSSPLQIPPPVD